MLADARVDLPTSVSCASCWPRDEPTCSTKGSSALLMSTPTPLFAINAADIDLAGRSIDADLPVDWLDKLLADVEAKATEPGRISVRLSRSGNEIVVRGKAQVSLHAPCGRCLSPAKLDIEGELGLLLQPAKTPPPGQSSDARSARTSQGTAGKAVAGAASGTSGKGKKAPKERELPEYEFSSDEADVDTFDGETVVLDDFVREAILLEMPIFPLCSEDCPGIRPASSDAVDEGAEPRVDPRLAPLGALRAALAQSKAGQDESNHDHSGAQPRSPHAPHRKKTK